MKSIDFLYTALAAFALIHGTYLTMIVRRYRRLSRELQEIGKK